MEILNNLLNPITMAFCLAIGYMIKSVAGDNATVKKLIPTICGLIGLVVACLVHKTISQEVAATGMVSGLASTGLYEAFNNWINHGGNDEDKTDGD